MKKYALNSFWILFEKASKIGLYFLLGILLARYLGPENFGNYSLILSILSITTGIAAFGLNGLLVKEFVDKDDFYKVLHSSVIARGVGILIGILISIVSLLYTFNGALDIYLILIVSFSVTFSIVQVVDYYFASRLESAISAKYRVTGYVIGFLLKLLFLLNNSGYLYLVLAHVFELFSIFLLGYLTLLFKAKKSDIFKIIIYKSYIKELLNKGWPLLISGFAVILYMKIDQFFIYKFLDASEVGIYTSATRLCEGLFLISAIVIPSFFPSLVNFKKKNDLINYKKYFQKLFIVLFIFGIILALFINLYSKEIILLLYGNDYINAHMILAIYSISLPIIYVGDLLSRWLIIEDLVKYSMLRHFLGLIVNLFLNSLLIPRYGIEGAAIASVFAYLFAVFIFLLSTKKTRSFYKLLYIKAEYD